MAEIYNPWQQPATDNDISFAAEEFSEGAEHESADAPEGGMLAEALSVIDSQSRTIKKLMALLTGEAPAAGDMG
jgi:hypothetical protein